MKKDYIQILRVLLSFAVPIFFMISAATLINYRDRYSTMDFWGRGVIKTGMHYIGWTLLCILWLIIGGKHTVLEVFYLRFIFSDILNHNSQRLHWFFTPLFAIFKYSYTIFYS